MKVTPVQSYKKANYPDKERIKADPALLLSMPKRWLRNGATCAVLAVTSILLLSRSKPEPTFDLGEFMGINVSPSFYIESDAETIIEEEFRAAGIHMKPSDLAMNDLSFPVYYVKYGKVAIGQTTAHSGFSPDGYDAEKHIAYDFEVDDLNHEWYLYPSFEILQSGNQAQGADSFVRAVNADTPDFALAMFQDNDTSDLRAQVRDFLAWLKAQGIE